MDESQRLLTRAQQIAQEYYLSRLAMKISMEHDQLLDNLDKWKDLELKNAPISERLNLSSVEGDLNRIIGKKQVVKIQTKPEEPLLLSIISKSGISLYNHYFFKDWKHNLMFSSFMTAFNAFSDEMFAKTLDRIKIGENTILVNSINELIICYIIKGQSYPAQQKLIKLSNEIKNSE